jgi:hypothetical protein
MERKDPSVNHIALDKQDEAVKQFVLSLPIDPNGSVLELEGRPIACVLPPPSEDGDDEPWTKEKNDRRCDLIDRKYEGAGLTPAEALELARLQEQMLRYRQRVAPLPWRTRGACTRNCWRKPLAPRLTHDRSLRLSRDAAHTPPRSPRLRPLRQLPSLAPG